LTIDPDSLNSESVARALLCSVDGVGEKIFHKIIEEVESVQQLFQSPETLYEADLPDLRGLSLDSLKVKLSEWEMEPAAERLAQKNIGVLSEVDPHYPSFLKETYSPPPVLYYRGNPDLLTKPSVAIVGTRRCSEGGREIAADLGAGLADLGLTIVSGMAAGIDTAAHRGALEKGKTVAVLGTGVDRVYPARNRKLYDRLSKDHLLISEYPPGTKPHPTHFPARNRIISGLSRAVIVVQAPQRSGALITADFALEQGREVFAVPGAVGDGKHSGCHMLIKRGAALVESVEDVVDFLQLEGQFSPREQTVEISSAADELLQKLSYKPCHIDGLVADTGFSIAECSRLLLELEAENIIHALPGQRYQKSQDLRHLEVQVK